MSLLGSDLRLWKPEKETTALFSIAGNNDNNAEFENKAI